MAQFLTVKSPEEVLEIIQGFPPLEAEEVPLEEASGRVLAEPLAAPEPITSFPRAVMDGFAVRARDTFGASESLPGFLEIGGEVVMGRAAEAEVKPGTAVAIPTGGMLPPGADAVVMVEHTQWVDEKAIEVNRAVAPGENLLQEGEDIPRGGEALPAGHLIRPQDVGVPAALGIPSVLVHRRPKVAILSTGDEIVPVTTRPLPPGKIRDINAYTLAAQTKRAGGLPSPGLLIQDDLESLTRACRQALEEHDVVLLSGGSSVGARDYTARILEGLPGSRMLVQGVAIRPGKPTILGRVGGKGFWGLPGHPASALMVFTAFVRPFLMRLQGRRKMPQVEENRRRAVLARNLPSVSGREDYFPVVLTLEEKTLKATPLFGKSAMISLLARAHGYVVIPARVEGLDEGTEVEVRLFSGG